MPRTEPPTTQPLAPAQPGAGQVITDPPASAQSALAATNPPNSLARSALLLSIGNIASRVLGLVREMVIARTFDDALVSAFTIASQVPTLLYDFLIGGMLSAALVPILSEYAHRDRNEFTRLVGLLLTLFGTVLLILTGLLYLAAPQVAWLLAGGFSRTDPTLLPLTTDLIRSITPAVWLFSMAGLLTAVLYALQRFTWPALATALYNLGIVVAAPLLAGRIGVKSLVVGILAGACAQFLLMALDLHRVGFKLRPQWDWRHPALARVLRLYLPIALGLVVMLFQVGLDRRLASGTDAASLAWMRYATTLQQLPLGLISVAISLAALPRLSQYFAAGQELAYRQTLGRGLRMVMLLIIPAAIILWFLGEPLTQLLFGSNRVNAPNTTQIVLALQVYLVGMLFAAIDFPLNYAFYARNNTLLPALVGLLSVVVYVGVALLLLPLLGYLGLVWADSAKQASHALVMLLLLRWQIGGLHGQVVRGGIQMLLAALPMAAVIGGLHYLLHDRWPGYWLYNGITIATVGGLGLALYLLILQRLRLAEVTLLQTAVRTRLGL